MLNYRLKNYFFFLVLLLVSGSAAAQPASRKNGKVKLTSESMKAGAFIDVNVASYPESSYNIQQLVQQVLINGTSSCATPNVSNVTVTPNHPVTNNDRFWGYFHKGTTNFPFEDGIVLSTGYARQAGNAAIAAATRQEIKGRVMVCGLLRAGVAAG